MSAQGRRIFITGGASGLGRALAERYARDGWRVCIGDLDVGPGEPEPFPASESVFTEEPVEVHVPEHPSVPTTDYDSLVGDSAAASAASAFAGFASTLRKPEPMEASTGSGPTLDELARSLLRPMLKEWLDANLPGIVEAQVRKEVERIARNAG